MKEVKTKVLSSDITDRKILPPAKIYIAVSLQQYSSSLQHHHIKVYGLL